MGVSTMANGRMGSSTAEELLLRSMVLARLAAGRMDVILSGLKIALKPEPERDELFFFSTVNATKLALAWLLMSKGEN